ncbi:MAG TPA: D-aminoacyl-tRNA deacylase [Lacunisphaera sp.]|jgi:D-tyrosyl-tRNA(Tyr) deacylase|nr:D-aminoacyl-tRNA deacylase [Lacunisphaera sp.]
MRVVVQRVTSASVAIAGSVTAQIGTGLVVLVGIEAADTPVDGEWLAQKISKLRIFPDDSGQMNQSVVDAGGEVLVVSQFTLHASTQKGTRPSFHAAARPEIARPLYDDFVARISAATARPAATGEFGALMAISLVNDGPVTLMLDSKRRE